MRAIAIGEALMEKGHEIVSRSESADWLVIDLHDSSEFVPLRGPFKRVIVITDGDNDIPDWYRIDGLIGFIPELGDRTVKPTIRRKIHQLGELIKLRNLEPFVVCFDTAVGDDFQWSRMIQLMEKFEPSGCTVSSSKFRNYATPCLHSTLGVGDGGQAAMERLWMGLPQIIIPSGREQRLVADWIQSLGCAEIAVNFDEAAQKIAYYSKNSDAFCPMARACMQNSGWTPGQYELVEIMENGL
jgi:hypothetical protein